MFSLKVPTITGMKSEQINGLLLSYLSAATEVTEGKRKVSYLTHFYKERLNKFERKKLSLILDHLISQLAKEGNKESHLHASTDSQELQLPEAFAKFFQFFQRI